MTIEWGTLAKVGLIIYLFVLMVLIIRKKYTMRQHILFFLTFCLYIAFLSVMLFPIEIEDFNSVPYVESRLYKHNAIPFSYIIRNMQGERAVDAIIKSYFIENPTAAQLQESLLIMQNGLHRIILFILTNFTIITSIVFLRLWHSANDRSIKRSILPHITLILLIDILHFIRYYYFSLEVESFDSSFVLFQILSFVSGYLLYRASRYLVGIFRAPDRMQAK